MHVGLCQGIHPVAQPVEFVRVFRFAVIIEFGAWVHPGHRVLHGEERHRHENVERFATVGA